MVHKSSLEKTNGIEEIKSKSILIIESIKEGNKIKLENILGGNINQRDEDGNTLLIVSLKEDKKEIMRFLIKNRADLDAINTEGNTALIIASGLSYIDIVKYLLESGARINIRNNVGTNAFDASKIAGHEEVAKLLTPQRAIPSLLDLSIINVIALHKNRIIPLYDQLSELDIPSSIIDIIINFNEVGETSNYQSNQFLIEIQELLNKALKENRFSLSKEQIKSFDIVSSDCYRYEFCDLALKNQIYNNYFRNLFNIVESIEFVRKDTNYELSIIEVHEQYKNLIVRINSTANLNIDYKAIDNYYMSKEALNLKDSILRNGLNPFDIENLIIKLKLLHNNIKQEISKHRKYSIEDELIKIFENIKKRVDDIESKLKSDKPHLTSGRYKKIENVKLQINIKIKNSEYVASMFLKKEEFSDISLHITSIMSVIPYLKGKIKFKVIEYVEYIQ